jgi:hypothetical protein
MDYGIKVTKDGKEVDSTNSLDYILDSKYPNMFTYKFGTGSYTFADASQSAGTINIATIPHGLDYIPSYVVYFTDNFVDYVFLPLAFYYYNTNDPPTYQVQEHIKCYSDATNLYIDFWKYKTGLPPAGAWKDMTGVTFYYKYYIFTDKAY